MGDAVGTMANRPADVSNFDRLAIVSGSALEQAEVNTVAIQALTKAVVEGNKETHRLLGDLVRNGNGNGRRFHRARQMGPPALAGGGVFGILEFIKVVVGA